MSADVIMHPVYAERLKKERIAFIAMRRRERPLSQLTALVRSLKEPVVVEWPKNV